MSILLLILGLILFVALVVVHEFGHYLAARRNGVEVEEFGIGFPPRFFKRRLKNGVLLTLNWLPLGGFVRLKGENDSSREKGSYGAASLKNKTKIMMAGVGMNLLAAFVLFTVVALVGMPQLVDKQFTINRDTKVIKNEVLIGYVEPDSPAEKAGLQLRDQITSITSNPVEEGMVRCLSLDCEPAAVKINDAGQLPQITENNAGNRVEVTYIRGTKTNTIITQLRSKTEVEASQNTDNPLGYLGISPTEYTLQRSTWSAPIVALGIMKQFTVLTFQGIGHALGALFDGNTTKASEQVSGPVGIFVILKDGSLLGYELVLMIVAVISLTLAIMNILPIPALDGGRLFVTWLFRLLRKPLTKRAETLIHGSGFMLLMLLFVVITVVDVKRFF
jgi:regulator of sigma E protease